MKLSPFEVPQRPDALRPSRLAGLAFWGDRTPPKDFAQVFNAVKSEETGADAKTRQVATLRLYGPIYDGWFGISARKVSQALDQLGDVDAIVVRVNSPGGDAWEGMAILNMFRAHAAEVTAVVDGVAASAASYLVAGCDHTVMSPGTQMMIHDASAFAYGPAETMAKAEKFLNSVSNAIASIYADIAGGTDESWRALMKETTWYTAKEAVASGLANSVGIVKDAGETETAEEQDLDELDTDVEDRFDLSMYPFAGRSKAPAPQPPNASAVGSPHTEGGPAVAFSDEQITTMRAKLGLPETADEAAILVAVEAVVDESLEDKPAPAAPAVPDGMALIDKAVLDGLRSGAEDGRAARDEQRTQARDAAIQKAVASGKIPKTRREHYQTAWDADPEGTRDLLDKLEPGLVPLDELGHDNPVDEAQTEDDAVYAALFGDDEKKAS